RRRVYSYCHHHLLRKRNTPAYAHPAQGRSHALRRMYGPVNDGSGIMCQAMKRILLAPLIVALLFAACSGQQRAPAGSVDTVRSLLWRIDKAGSKTSWLFGTMHMICSEDYLWTEAMEQGLRQSSLVCLEMDMDDPATIMQVAAGMMDT